MPRLATISKPLVTVMVPFSRNPSPEWAFSFASILGPMNGTMMLTKIVNKERGFARTKLAYDAWKRGSKYGLFIDDDNTVPPNIIRQLLFEFENQDDDVMVIGGIYTTKTYPPMPLVYQNIGDGPFYRWKFGQVFPCELIATGMMCIKMELFDKLYDPKPIYTGTEITGFESPWFKEIRGVEEGKKYDLIPQDYEGRNFESNDDGFFCNLVIKAGYKIMAHGGCLGLHWDDAGTAYAIPDNCYAFKTELQRKYPDLPKSQEEYEARCMAIYRSLYGYSDFAVKQEQDEVLEKAGTGV